MRAIASVAPSGVALALVLAWPVPALAGQFVLESEPSGAEVYMDGRHLGQTPLSGEVPDGAHEVTLQRKGYRPGSLTIRVLPDLTTRRQVQLARQGVSGELRVTSEPTGARVLLDGTDVGHTPLHLRQVSPGKHSVVLRRPGYRDGRATLRVVADLTTARHLSLGALPAAPPVAVRPVPARPKPAPVPERPHQAERPKPRPAEPIRVAPVRPPERVAVRPRPTERPIARPSARPVPEASLRPVVPARPVAPTPALPWKHMAFYGLMGMFLALVAGALWQRRDPRPEWQGDKPLARFQPLTPGRVPMAAVECCLRGIRLIQAGEKVLGAETMLAAYRQAPTVQMIYNLALSWHLAGSPLAETAYRAAIQLDPAHRDARYNLAKLLADTGRPHEALLAYRALVSAVPTDGSAWFNLGTLQARLGMGREAVAALRRARRILKDDAACRHNLRLAKQVAPWWVWRRRGAKRLVAASG